MTHGKEICRTLKSVRNKIAEVNNIDYKAVECSYKGECSGTCPKCEEELKWLEEQLKLKEKTGEAVKLDNIASGLISRIEPTQQELHEIKTYLNYNKNTKMEKEQNKSQIQALIESLEKEYKEILEASKGMSEILKSTTPTTGLFPTPPSIVINERIKQLEEEIKSLKSMLKHYK